MNARERLAAAVFRRPLDRPPLVCPGGMMTMAVREAMELLGCAWPEAHTDAALMARLSEGMVELAGLENLGVPYCLTVEAEGMGGRVELGHATREPHVTGYALIRPEDLATLRRLDSATGRAGVACRAVRRLKDRNPHLPVIANLTGPVSLATSLVDPLLYYRALRRNPAAVHRLNAFCTGEAIRFGEALLAAGADHICIADPSATGDLLGPAAFKEFCLPYLNRMSEHFGEGQKTGVIIHICGNIKVIGHLLRQLAAPVVSVDSIVSIKTLRELAPDKVAMGNVSTFTLEKGSPDKVAAAASLCLNQGVEILAPACGISPVTPLANLRALAGVLGNSPNS